MDDLAFGRLVRMSRLRRDWTQDALGSLAGVSKSEVSRIELGRIDGIPVRTLRAVCKPLEIRVELSARGVAGDADRLLNARHAAMAEASTGWLTSFDGWVVRPELSFAWYGERGIVDLVCWNEARRALLLVELKTEIDDIGEILGVIDRRHRLAREIVAGLGWVPEVVGSLLLVAEGSANRQRVRAHARLFDAALPDRFARVREWLRSPSGPLRGMAFFGNSRHLGAITDFATPRRARRRNRPNSSRNAAPGGHSPQDPPLG